MTGVLLVNMGGPESLAEMRKFLKRMFLDPFILPLSPIVRHIVSSAISITRYKKSWERYRSIGGTPAKSATIFLAEELGKELGSGYIVNAAFSYSSPTIKDGINDLIQKEIENIKVIPLYPQYCICTTGSVKADVNKVAKHNKKVSFEIVDDFYNRGSFIHFWETLIMEHLRNNNYNSPLLLFSAHSIPKYLIDTDDPYVKSIDSSARLISEKLGLKYEIAFQSKMGRIKWAEPDTKTLLKELALKGLEEIIIIPISFVNENLETLYDIDKDIIPYGKEQHKINKLSRVLIPEGHPLLITMLKEIICE